jgi:uncharacterized membrane protein YfhO
VDNALEVIEDWPGHLVINTASEADGMLVISEAYYPGWVAEVNGQQVPVVQADGYLQAVPVPAGNATVRLDYRPPLLIWGGIISVATLLLSSAFIFARKFYKPKSPEGLDG